MFFAFVSWIFFPFSFLCLRLSFDSCLCFGISIFFPFAWIFRSSSFQLWLSCLVVCGRVFRASAHHFFSRIRWASRLAIGLTITPDHRLQNKIIKIESIGIEMSWTMLVRWHHYRLIGLIAVPNETILLFIRKKVPNTHLRPEKLEPNPFSTL